MAKNSQLLNQVMDQVWHQVLNQVEVGGYYEIINRSHVYCFW